MNNEIAKYSIIAAVLLLSTILYIRIAKRFGILDNPTARSSHSSPTIRGGGILFYIAAMLAFFLSEFSYPYFILGLSIIAIVSFIDDIYSLSARVRLPFHFIAVALLLYQLGIFDVSTFWIWGVLVLAVGFINGFNFMDGINGITFLYSMTAIGALAVLNFLEPTVNDSLLISVLISLVIFGFLNFRTSAVLFAGDIGSMSLAMIVLFVVIHLAVDLKSPLILCMVLVYFVDIVFTIIQRIFLGEPVSKPHRRHVYQKLVDVAGWSHLKVSFAYAGLQLLICVFVLFTYKTALHVQISTTIALFIVLAILYYAIFKRLKKIGNP